MQNVLKIGLTILLICFLCAKTYPSTNETETSVSRSGLKNSPQRGYSGLLFAQQMEDSVKAESLDSIKLRDPRMAALYAIMPGMLVHGSGHFYAGEKTTGWVLVAGEILSLAMLTYSIGVGIGKSTDGATSNGSSEVVGVVGVALFMGTWIYDVIGAPLAVEKQNRKLHEKKSANLKFEFDHKYHYARTALIQEF
jgi:hypothetical protein